MAGGFDDVDVDVGGGYGDGGCCFEDMMVSFPPGNSVHTGCLIACGASRGWSGRMIVLRWSSMLSK